MKINKITLIFGIISLAGCSSAPPGSDKYDQISKDQRIELSFDHDNCETLKNVKIHYAQALISEELSDTLRMREEYDLAVSLLGEIVLTEKTSDIFEKEFHGAANKVSKDYQLSLRRLLVRYGDASDISLMEKLELFDGVDDTAGMAIKVLQEYADDLETEIPLRAL